MILLPFVHLSAKKVKLYEAPNRPSVHLKVSYYHRCLYRQTLRTTEQGFPLFVHRAYEALASSELYLFVPIYSTASGRLYFSQSTRLRFTHYS